MLDSVHSPNFQSRYHRITEWLGLEGTLKIIKFQSLLWAGLPPHQDRLPRAPSNLVLSTSRGGAPMASLGSLCQYLSVFLWSHMQGGMRAVTV